MIKKDCFAYKGGACKALTKLICKNKVCPFYKQDMPIEKEEKRGPKFRDDITREKIIELKEEGKSLMEIAKILRCTYSTVVRRLSGGNHARNT